jgi:uncharacterized LabA/DUF88 family protein
MAGGLMRVGIFVDISNLYHSCMRKFGRKVNFRKMLELLLEPKDTVTHSICYGVGSSGNVKFFNYLKNVGFQEINIKQPKSFSDGTTKADQDLQIASDIMRYIDDFDALILVSADGDFAPILQLAIDKGKHVCVFGCGISFELTKIAHHWWEVPESILETDKTT